MRGKITIAITADDNDLACAIGALYAATKRSSGMLSAAIERVAAELAAEYERAATSEDAPEDLPVWATRVHDQDTIGDGFNGEAGLGEYHLGRLGRARTSADSRAAALDELRRRLVRAMADVDSLRAALRQRGEP